MLCEQAKPSQAKPSQAKQGFTLVELSIVIVIIGLIISGVMAGQSLVHAARLSRTVTEVNQIIMATDAFQMQYNCLPGDCKNATSYWSSGTLNGDGNNIIGSVWIAANGQSYESQSALQQLGFGYANLIPGAYTGSGTPKIGVNQPQSAYSSSSTYWFFGDNLWNNYPYGTSLVLSGAVSPGVLDYKASVDDAYAIDSKIDDGMPYTGKVVGYNFNANNCVAAVLSSHPNHQTSTYLVGNGTLCTMDFALTRYKFR